MSHLSPVTFVICAAGEGLRMKSVSENIPKALLTLKHKSLLEWSLESLDLRSHDQVIIVHRFDFETDRLRHQLQSTYQNVQIDFFKIDRLTAGQAETAFLAKHLILHQRIVLFNADTFFRSNSLRTAISQNHIDGIIPCFKASGNSWSFCKVDESGAGDLITEVTEKVRISDWCSVGYYYFKDRQDFFDSYEDSLRISRQGERYIAPLYNDLIFKQKNIRLVSCEVCQPMGTPEQILDFWGVTVEQMKIENTAG